MEHYFGVYSWEAVEGETGDIFHLLYHVVSNAE